MNVNESDLISRQAAIAVADSSDYVGLSVEDVKKVTDEVVKGLKRLPSAQPEIIRCKDCKYNYGLMHGGEFNPDDIVCTFFDTDGMQYCDFCSYAERRTDE